MTAANAARGIPEGSFQRNLQLWEILMTVLFWSDIYEREQTGGMV